MKVLLIQIAARQTHHLTLSLIKWPAVELSLFIAETMACMPPDWCVHWLSTLCFV